MNIPLTDPGLKQFGSGRKKKIALAGNVALARNMESLFYLP